MEQIARIALLRVGNPFSGDATPAVKFHLEDHLGSNSIVVDEANVWVNREEYTPYGETSFGSFSRKGVRYSGKERDSESDLYYFGARSYIPWLGRWASSDPAGRIDGLNLYEYVRSNPLNMRDRSGLDGESLPGGTGRSPEELSTGAEPVKEYESPEGTKSMTRDVLDTEHQPSRRENESSKIDNTVVETNSTDRKIQNGMEIVQGAVLKEPPSRGV